MNYKINMYTFKYVNPNTCKAFDMLNSFDNTNDKSLYNAYARPSALKQLAYHNCCVMSHICNGYRACIPTHSSQAFTFAFLVDCIKGNDFVNTATNEHGTTLIPDYKNEYANTITYLVYITANNMYITDYIK